jgi:hypothetical protein
MTLWIDEKYLTEISSTLSQFKKKRTGLYNCRCPYCGDSDKSKLKARGYFYAKQGSMFYRCHNCGASTTLSGFLHEHHPDTFKRYRLETFKESGGTRKKKVEEPEYKSKSKFKLTPEVLKGIQKISELPVDHEAYKYLTDRLIPEKFYSKLYYVDMLEDISRRIEKYKDEEYDAVPRIVIPSFNEKNELTHLACRALGPSTLRYMTLVVKEDAPKIFGLDRVDRSKTIYVCEGQFDSMFLPNAVAAGGSDLESSEILGDDVVYIFDNEPRSKQIMSKVGKLIRQNKSVVIWGKIKGKDINEMILNGKTIKQVVEHIRERTFKGPAAQMKFTEYRKTRG